MDKPFKSIDDQIKILESRGLEIDSSTPQLLQRYGYYSVINGYKDVFIDRWATGNYKEDRYKTGSSFNDIFMLYKFDRDLQLIMFRYFSIAEETLKTVSAYEFAKKFKGISFAYLDIHNYRNEDSYAERIDRLINDFKNALGQNPDHKPRKKEYLEHYCTNHDNVPIWVVLRYMTFGNAFKFFEFQQSKVRNAIACRFAKLYNESYSNLTNRKIYDRQIRLAYDHIKDFRNICAHNERLYCAKVGKSHDIKLIDVIRDLNLVLTKEDYSELISSTSALLVDLNNSLGIKKSLEVMNLMGIKTMEDLLELSNR